MKINLNIIVNIKTVFRCKNRFIVDSSLKLNFNYDIIRAWILIFIL